MWCLGREMNSWGNSKPASPLIDFPLLAPMHVMKQPKRGLELQISNGVKRMERNVERGGTRVKERRGRWHNGEKWDCFTILPRGGGKRKLPGWTGQTGPTDRSDRSHLKCQKEVVFQTIRVNLRSIRAKIQTIREIDHKEVLVWIFLDQMVKHFQKFIFSDLMC